MARSNGPMTPPGPGARRTARPDPQSWAQGTTPQATAPRAATPQQSYAPQSQSYAPQGQSYAPPQDQSYAPQSAGAAYQQAAYGAQPGQPSASDPRRAPAQDPRTAPPQRQPQAAPSSAFDNFVAQQTPSAYGNNAPSYGQQAYPSLNTAAGQSGGYGESADQNGFGQWANPAPAADTRGFDYGSFAASPAPASQPAGHTGYYGNSNQAGYGQLDSGAHDPGYGGEWGQGGYDQDSLTAGGYDDAGYPLQPGHDQEGHGVEHSYDEDFDDEPKRRSKMPLIAAAVAVAVLCGGGLAYGYKTLLGPVPAGGDMPVIKTSSIPSKVKPDDPGGRKFAHSEPSIMGGSSKVMGEPLGEAAGAASAEGARKVQTVEVRPDGSVVPSSGSTSGPAMANASAFPSVGETGHSAPAAEAPPEPEPQVMAKAEPPAAAASEPVEDNPAPAAVPPKKVQSKKVAATSAPQGAISPAPSGAGWVAVLASVPVSSSSQMDSLKQFADMQQKYNEVLGDKTPSVQEANLGEKGHYHRLVVGPPASRDSASSICGSLKTAGYSGCWVMQY